MDKILNVDIEPSDYKILIVDDILSNVLLLKALLKNEKYRTVTAGNGTEALKAVEQEPVDLILLDVMMPDISGFDVAKQLIGPEIQGYPHHLPDGPQQYRRHRERVPVGRQRLYFQAVQ